MTMTITHLGTGSRGNSTLLETPRVKVLVDQGFSGAQLAKRLARLELKPEDIDCVFISHHHGDHGGGAKVLQTRWNIRVLANERTALLVLKMVGSLTSIRKSWIYSMVTPVSSLHTKNIL